MWSVAVGLYLALLTPQSLAAQKAEKVPDTKITQAFDQYERIRTSLSTDSMTAIKEAATALAPLAKEVGGAQAANAATKLAAATTIQDARTHFGEVSDALVETFLAAGIPGVHGFTCAIVKKPWAQKGDKTQNRYYGKTIATCGVPLKAITAR